MKAKLYKPAKTAMQSGAAKTKKWLLEFESKDRKFIEPLMGWTGSSDTRQQLRMFFDSEERALEYAKRNGIEVQLEAANTRRVKPKAYADNFSFKRIRAAEG